MGSKTAHNKIPRVKYKKHTQRYWFNICLTYRSGKFSSMASFLRSDISDDDITDTNIYRSYFAKKLGKIDEEKLKYLYVTRIKVRQFQAIEDKLNDLLEAHEK